MADTTVLTFRKCDCGAEFKIVATPDGKKQSLSCECQRQHTIAGTAIDVYRKARRASTEWIKVSREKITELP